MKDKQELINLLLSAYHMGLMHSHYKMFTELQEEIEAYFEQYKHSIRDRLMIVDEEQLDFVYADMIKSMLELDYDTTARIIDLWYE